MFQLLFLFALLVSDGYKENVRIYRQCGWLSTRNDSTCKNSGNNSVWETNCACWTDGCNSSNEIRFDFTVLTIVAAFKLICWYMFVVLKESPNFGTINFNYKTYNNLIINATIIHKTLNVVFGLVLHTSVSQ